MRPARVRLGVAVAAVVGSTVVAGVAHATPSDQVGREQAALAAELRAAGPAAAGTSWQAHGTACGGSTPATQTYADSIFDGDGTTETSLAPELGTVTLSVDAACAVRGTVTLHGEFPDLHSNDMVGYYLDTDGNRATGSATFDGADHAVVILGQPGADAAPQLLPWSPALATFDVGRRVSLAPQAPFGFVAGVDQLHIANGTSVGARVGSIHSGLYYDYFDFAPDSGLAPFRLGVAFGVPASAAPPAPVTPVGVVAVAAPVSDMAPRIGGTATVGSVLFCAPGTWANGTTTLAYRWVRGATQVGNGQNHRATFADAGKPLACVVTASNAAGVSEATSPSVQVRGVAPVLVSRPLISGQARVGRTLRCSAGSWQGATTTRRQWLRDGRPVANGTRATYRVTRADAGHRVTCRLTATNPWGSGKATSRAVRPA